MARRHRGANGNVRHFVAMQLGKGYTVKAQITGEELFDGLQIEITPAKTDLEAISSTPLTRTRKSEGTMFCEIFIKTRPLKTITIQVSILRTTNQVKLMVEAAERILAHQQRFMYNGQLPEARSTIRSCKM